MSALKKFFSKLSLINDHAKRLAVFETLNEELNIGSSYLILLIGSSIVATLGLLINSSVVVMGAMLMAPLYWPIIGVALGVVSGHKKLLLKALKITLISTLIALIFSSASAYLSPLAEITHEIQVRASPTLLDLLIALATSIIGILAIYDPRVSSSVVGVALSLSLLPPLSAAGVGISLGNGEIFWGAFQLYLANVVSIVFVGAITFYALNFRPGNNEEKKRFSLGLSTSLFFLAILGSLFTIYLQQSIYTSKLITEIDNELRTELRTIHPEIKADNVIIGFSNEGSLWHANIEAMVYLPEDQMLTRTHQDHISAKIGRLISGQVNLQLNLVNTLIAESREKTQQQWHLRDRIQSTLVKEINDQQLGLSIIDLRVEEMDDMVKISLVLVNSENEIDYSQFREKLLRVLEDKLEQQLELTIQVISATQAL